MKCEWLDPFKEEDTFGKCFHLEDCIYAVTDEKGNRYCSEEDKVFEKYYENTADMKIDKGVDY